MPIPSGHSSRSRQGRKRRVTAQAAAECVGKRRSHILFPEVTPLDFCNLTSCNSYFWVLGVGRPSVRGRVRVVSLQRLADATSWQCVCRDHPVSVISAPSPQHKTQQTPTHTRSPLSVPAPPPRTRMLRHNSVLRHHRLPLHSEFCHSHSHSSPGSTPRALCTAATPMPTHVRRTHLDPSGQV